MIDFKYKLSIRIIPPGYKEFWTLRSFSPDVQYCFYKFKYSGQPLIVSNSRYMRLDNLMLFIKRRTTSIKANIKFLVYD